MIVDFSVAKQKIIWPKERFFIEGSVGHVYLRCSFDSDWDGLSKQIIFTNGDISRAVLLTDNEPVCVPYEVLMKGKLFISIVGLGADGVKRLTTRKMILPVAILEAGAIEGDNPDEYTPQLWEQALTAIGDMRDLKTSDRTSLVNALNEVILRGGNGEGSTAAGVDGVGIATIIQTSISNDAGGKNTIMIKLTDGREFTFNMYNGAKGTDGIDGKDGIDGRTPVRGTDYWTTDDINTIKGYVDTAILGGAW